MLQWGLEDQLPLLLQWVLEDRLLQWDLLVPAVLEAL